MNLLDKAGNGVHTDVRRWMCGGMDMWEWDS